MQDETKTTYPKDVSTKPWFVISIVITFFMIGLLGWNLFFSFNLLHSFKNQELAVERASWKLLLYAKTMTMATRVGTLSGNLKWKKNYNEAQSKLKAVIEKIPELISSPRIDSKAKEIQKHLSNIKKIERQAYVLVSQGKKQKAIRLLAGWNYTNNQLKFEKATKEVVKLIQKRIQKKSFLQRRQILILISVVAVCLIILIFSWTVTVRFWRIQVKNKKNAEEALRENEAKYRKLINSSPDAIALVDEQGKFLTVNPSMAQRLGRTPQELEGEYFHDVYPQDFAGQRLEKVQEAITKNEVVEHDDEKNGYYLQNYFVPIFTSGKQKTTQIISRDITLEKQMENRLKQLSIYDSLTNLYSRHFFEEEMRRLQESRYLPVGMIIFDIDGLKLINDTIGHDKGDKMLIVAAEILQNCFRKNDILARIGGDEFAALLPQNNEQSVNNCYHRVRKELENYNKEDPEFGLSMSIGYAVKSTPPVDMNKLFKIADDNMYKEKLQQSNYSRSNIFQTLVKIMEFRDYISEGHGERLQKNAQKMGYHLGLSQEKQNNLKLLGRFHDLGKVGISEKILFKPGALTQEEYQEVQRHSEIGNRIALSISELAPIADLILKHHEWWNGQGYPLGLQGEEIPLECRILAIVDAYDIMTSYRPYKNAMSQQEALEELKRCAGSQFDPDLVEKFIWILYNDKD